MAVLPIGLSTGCFYELPIERVLADIAAAGFEELEISTAPTHFPYRDPLAVERVRALLDDLGLRAVSMHAPYNRTIDITSPERARRRHAVDELVRGAEAAARLGAELYVMHAGPEIERQHLLQEYVPRLRQAIVSVDEIVARCYELGLQPALENMLPHLVLGGVRQLLRFLAEDRAGRVAVCLDTGHARLGGEIETAVGELAAYMAVVHLHDNLGREDDHLPPGDGSIAWDHVVGQLLHFGFRGRWLLELTGRGVRDIPGTIAAAQRGREFLRSTAARVAPEDE